MTDVVFTGNVKFVFLNISHCLKLFKYGTNCTQKKISIGLNPDEHWNRSDNGERWPINGYIYDPFDPKKYILYKFNDDN